MVSINVKGTLHQFIENPWTKSLRGAWPTLVAGFDKVLMDVVTAVVAHVEGQTLSDAIAHSSRWYVVSVLDGCFVFLMFWGTGH